MKQPCIHSIIEIPCIHLFIQDIDIFNKNLIEDPTKQIPGFDLPRKIWCKLNCFRTGHGKCNNMLFHWNIRENPSCFLHTNQQGGICIYKFDIIIGCRMILNRDLRRAPKYLKITPERLL
jgi:hypothetical protein